MTFVPLLRGDRSLWLVACVLVVALVVRWVVSVRLRTVCVCEVGRRRVQRATFVLPLSLKRTKRTKRTTKSSCY